MYPLPRAARLRQAACPSAPPPTAAFHRVARLIRAGAVCAGLLAGAAAAAAPTYQFSPVNQYNVQVTASFWNPIMEYVSQKSGVTLRLKIGRTSADTTSFVLAQEVDFAFSNHLFSPERERMGWRVLARRDAPPVRSQLVTLADSPVKNVAQLAGGDVAFPGPEALVAYKVSYAELLRRDVPVNVVFAGNMDGAFAQLESGKARAVGANSQLAEAYAARTGRPLRVLWQSAPFNDLALMVSRRVPAAQADAVARAFLGMATDPRGRRILDEAAALIKMAPFTFVPAKEGDYDAYRDFYSRAPARLR
ncbi:phosphonate transport system substrate-binding protein [Pseudoduganella lurida]|uniref:Phosphonate transport system substrate-binding protein n=1 Tax=Pseudoduganella lurida TaxID=1036180 RepID=A0A562RKE6_9BURK|nr:PhnD/SsuA/transferrin family substrate-binding protein [Pseudoduganella lurida]TWI69525.1 phosphonate transport system substrate-binding protein [Pseudoduganella lurida]